MKTRPRSKLDQGLAKLLKEKRVVIGYLRSRGPKDQATSRGRPVGVTLVWKANNQQLKVGWTKHNPNDPYDRGEGFRRALSRGVPLEQLGVLLRTPWVGPVAELKAVVQETLERAQRYFTPRAEPRAEKPKADKPRAPRRRAKK
jgi:hypothetical protein